MSDITKLIAELKELEEKADSTGWRAMPGITPASWHIFGTAKGNRGIQGKMASHLFYNDADLIVAMRNALPELIAEIERRKEQGVRMLNQRLEMQREREAALANADTLAEAFNEELHKRVVAETHAEKAEAKARELERGLERAILDYGVLKMTSYDQAHSVGANLGYSNCREEYEPLLRKAETLTEKMQAERDEALAYLAERDCPCCDDGECPIKHMVKWNDHRDECLRLPEECWPVLIAQESAKREGEKS